MIRFYYFFLIGPYSILSTKWQIILLDIPTVVLSHFFLKIKKLIHTNLYYTSYVSSIAAKRRSKSTSTWSIRRSSLHPRFFSPLESPLYYPAFSGLQGFPLAFLSLGHWGTRACAFTPILVLHTGRASSGGWEHP